MAIPLYPLKIRQIRKETKDSASFVFDVPDEHKSLFYYSPAQFLTFEFRIKGQNFLRSYSISSSPLLDEPLRTTVKKVKGGVVSNYMLDHLKEGDVLMSRKPAGRFFKAPSDLKPRHYFLFAGGSGITPMFSILKTALLSDPKNQVTLFYANRNEHSIIYHSQIQSWLAQYPAQFKMVLILSQPENKALLASASSGFQGRLKQEHLQKYFSSLPVKQKNHLYYLCGPLGFMDTVEHFLLEQEVLGRHIRKESFLSASQKSALMAKSKASRSAGPVADVDEPAGVGVSAGGPDSEKPSFSAKKPELCLQGKEGEGEKAPPESIKAFIDEEEINIPAEPHIPILEQLLSAGYAPPFSCLSGSCMSCLAVLKKGRIIQEEKGILEEENIVRHEILTCQAQPESRLVEVDYDH